MVIASASGEGFFSKIANKIHGNLKSADGQYPNVAVARYNESADMKKSAGTADIVDPDKLQSLVDTNDVPTIAKQVHANVKSADGQYANVAMARYDEAGKMRDAGSQVVTREPLQTAVVANETPAVADQIHGNVKSADGQYPNVAVARYNESADMKKSAGTADIVDPDKLQSLVDTNDVPTIAKQVHANVKSADGQYANVAMARYDEAGKMRDAGSQVVTREPLQTAVVANETPAVADQIVTQVGEKTANPKTLSRQYPVGGQMMDAADKAQIIDRAGATAITSDRLRPGLSTAQEDSFRSGHWDKLALHKVAEESKLFSPEALSTVKSVITDLLESSIRTAIGWGDRQGALDKLTTVQSTGLINDEDVSRIRESYLLRDSLIDAGV